MANHAIEALWDMEKWKEFSNSQQENIIESLLESLGQSFDFLYAKQYGEDRSVRIATVRDRSTGIEFNIIPGGRFIMGLSTEELRDLRALDKKHEIDSFKVPLDTMGPTHQVSIHPFLCARYPLFYREASSLIELDDEPGRPDFSEPDDENTPIYLNLREVKRILEKTGFRLPSEAEREYTCRGGTQSLFYWGSSIPKNPENNVCLTHFGNQKKNDNACNPFGFVGLGLADFCSDTWHPNYLGAPNDGTAWIGKGKAKVIKGGAAALWPWQEAAEWLLLVSAMRISSDYIYEKMAGVRLTKSIVVNG